MFDFIADLDAYFCEKYANYDKLCILPGYHMPKMQASEVRADGRTYAYTLPANTMRLALQENKAELLADLKKKLQDKTFSFSFTPLGFFSRIANRYKKTGFVRIFKEVLSRYNLTAAEVGAELNVAPEIWKKIVNGSFMPTKNVLLTAALTSHISLQDTELLLLAAGYEWDFTDVKDVVFTYLLREKVYSRPMYEAALKEYNVKNLFFRVEETDEK